MEVVDTLHQEQLKTRETRMFRIIGPPGTGKTTHLGRICQHAARKYGSENVAVFSLTRAAAAAVSAKEIDGARIPLPKQNIGTLHSMAYRSLDRPEIADTPKNIAIWNEWITEQGHPTYKITGDSVDLDDSATEMSVVMATIGDEAYQQYGIARARLQSAQMLPTTTQGFITWWERFKDEADMMDFSELLEKAYENVDVAPGDPRVILLDEGQDTPLSGMRLVRKWGEKADWFFVVGDPLQNLYQWAGTDPEAFTYPVLPQDQQEVLSQSYRVPRKIRDFAFRWIEPHKVEVEAQIGTKIEYFPRRDAAGDPIEGEVRSLAAASWKYPDPALRDAEKYLEQGKEVMFIAACGYMLQPLIAAMRNRGIPFWNPYRQKRHDWNPLANTRGTSSAQRLLSFLRLDERVYGDDVRLWTPRELWNWVEILESKSLLKHGAKDRIQAAAERPLPQDEEGNTLSGELSLADLDTWFKDLNEVVDVAKLIAEGNALDWLRGRLLAGRRKGMEFPLTVAARQGPERLLKRPQVVVGTIHSLKGAEAEVAVIFPDLSGAGMANWTRSGPDKEGVRRAFYVAFTRASETLVLCQRATTSAITYPQIKG